MKATIDEFKMYWRKNIATIASYNSFAKELTNSQIQSYLDSNDTIEDAAERVLDYLLKIN